MSNLEVADIFNKFKHLLANLHPDQNKVINAITNCRTKVLGGHKQKCSTCDFERPFFNSCRNRFCPKCGFLARTKWIEKRMEDLLPCQYFHVVFTIPRDLSPIFLRNKRVCYDLLFKAASQTLKEVAENPDNLGAEIGFIGILHTWSQTLIDHPHVHFIVPGGGLNKEKTKWIKCKDGYLLPVSIFSIVFKQKLINLLRVAKSKGELRFTGDIGYLENNFTFQDLMDKCYNKNWVVYSKESFGGPEQVIKDLGGYTHRIGISNYRLIKLEGEQIYFNYRDPKNPEKSKVMVMHVKEFMRRFLLHVLPKGYMRIRHFGLLGNRYRKIKIDIIRKLNGIVEEIKNNLIESWSEQLFRVKNFNIKKYPKCSTGKLFETCFTENLLNSC